MTLYPYKPIANLDSLALVLGLKTSELLWLAKASNSLFFVTKTQIKKDGSKRITYDVKPRLKQVHERINNAFLKKVEYPSYLQGSLKGRDYLSNTHVHTDKRIIISEDVSNFFPSISKKVVHEAWVGVFNFSNEIAAILTELITLDGFLVQGGKASSYICNLVLWSREAKLVKKLNEKEIVYTRYVDDVTISSNNILSKAEISQIISDVYSMFRSIDAKPNRSKHAIMTKGCKQTVHRVNVDRITPSFSKKDRKKITTAVFQCEQFYRNSSSTEEYKALYRSALGRVNTMMRLKKNEKEGETLKKRLNNIKP